MRSPAHLLVSDPLAGNLQNTYHATGYLFAPLALSIIFPPSPPRASSYPTSAIEASRPPPPILVAISTKRVEADDDGERRCSTLYGPLFHLLQRTRRGYLASPPAAPCREADQAVHRHDVRLLDLPLPPPHPPILLDPGMPLAGRAGHCNLQAHPFGSREGDRDFLRPQEGPGELRYANGSPVGAGLAS